MLEDTNSLDGAYIRTYSADSSEFLPNICVYLFTFICINFVSGFWLDQVRHKWYLRYQKFHNQSDLVRLGPS